MSKDFNSLWLANRMSRDEKTESNPTRPELSDLRSERQLHEKIIEYCNTQWPKWKYIRARMDQRSTIGNGVHDFTVFMPGGKIIFFECKHGDNKLEKDQLIWKTELELLGHTVPVIRTMGEFLTLALLKKDAE